MPEKDQYSSSKSELTFEAKEAIRDYMFKITIPSAAALTLIAGLLGYVASGVARLEASKDTMDAMKEALRSADEAKSASERAAEASKNAQRTEETLKSVQGETDQILSHNYDSFSKSLFDTPGFRQALSNLPTQQTRDINQRFSGLKLWSNDQTKSDELRSNYANGFAPNTAYCSPGSYAVGMTAVGNANGDCSGCFYSIVLICKKLNL